MWLYTLSAMEESFHRGLCDWHVSYPFHEDSSSRLFMC